MSKKTFASLGHDLSQIVNEAEPGLKRITATDAAARTSPAKWTRKEILSHLIDSATNNHQRFVRGVEQKGGAFPSYSQDFLVKLQRANEAEWSLVIALWASYNRYLAHILSGLPPEAQECSCTVGDSKPMTVLFVAEDYVEHLKHHLKQILGRRWQSTYGAK